MSDEEKVNEIENAIYYYRPQTDRERKLIELLVEEKIKACLEERKKSKQYIEQLQNEKAELAEDFCKQLTELRAQIEKMKCCSNCSNFNNGNCTFSFRTKDSVTPFVKMHEDFFCIGYNKWRSK